MNENYFGYNCKYFNGYWRAEDRETDLEYLEPELVFCAHPGNPSNAEGNCLQFICPLKARRILDDEILS